MWTLLDLAGSVALLLWGLHMVQTGIQRGLRPRPAALARTALGNRARRVCRWAGGHGSSAEQYRRPA